MILDSDIQRKLLLALIQGCTFKGETVDVIYRLKTAIHEASLTETLKKTDDKPPNKKPA